MVWPDNAACKLLAVLSRRIALRNALVKSYHHISLNNKF
ncbi:MAG: hypothetical protein JWP93_2327 [Polaromonas sp.]|nr:hypothetical protein [Polaromonas sp.]